MYYSNREIYDSYMTAKNRTEQMKILMQLNLCSKEKIITAILEEFEHRKQNGGFLDAAKEREAERAVKELRSKSKKAPEVSFAQTAVYRSLPLETRQGVYQRICENCTYEEFLELTELPDVRTTCVAYRNLKQRAIREGHAIAHRPKSSASKRTRNAAAPDDTKTEDSTKTRSAGKHEEKLPEVSEKTQERNAVDALFRKDSIKTARDLAAEKLQNVRQQKAETEQQIHSLSKQLSGLNEEQTRLSCVLDTLDALKALCRV